MKFNEKDGVWYATSTEYDSGDGATVAPIKAMETAKVYVYETGKMYVSDGTTFHELGVADNS